MASRGSDRPYKVVYSTRTRDPDATIDSSPRQSYRREHDYDYDDDYPPERSYTRDYRDDRTDADGRSRDSTQSYSGRSSLPSTGGATKIKYEVVRDRNSDAYVKRANAMVIERPANSGRSEYEVIRPERRDDGTYVVDVGGGRARRYPDRDSDGYDAPTRARYYETAPEASLPSRRGEYASYDSPKIPDRDRAYYRDVEIVEDPEDDPRYSRDPRPPARGEGAPPLQRRKSAMRGRNETPPPERLRRKRSQSVGFYRDQLSHHDATEQRHERPGAEARIAGRYLRRGADYDDDMDMDDYRVPGRSGPRDDYYARRNDLRLNDYEYDDDRRTYTEETVRRYEYEDDQRPAYPPRARPYQVYRRDPVDDDDRSPYLGYDSRSRREYYR
ncbi:hypothetical protein HRR83_004284 [Exophiala dermatitidis]|uniref:Uncharacterized protein n=2 Tax=Exophiala dermatitidis TaxID=5970 RepID=H6BQQ5_EXODN|nr:uncharacterized protein HMPREF1120_02762 [Exophiala dermatitidis NIH/UT8656]KAJ4511678.1 hypothetical protein HRR73_006253 [Exophiala dermatitidis]EHY54594.1 hypothetical protein HMPREF1120_02762 [Exophiala dermatitidis NIH/UT8656]KAJ4517750.1 hypothetical protein HRR75_002968 [Exophiala dermatitidis]KAJ4521411.1 hypothetical protein HRR74_003234 [Exophiala dermatitidis]KAJ4542086.1 hypothetical protein HRR77_005970 [Exophiala dermatitidis]